MWYILKYIKFKLIYKVVFGFVFIYVFKINVIKCLIFFFKIFNWLNFLFLLN